MKHKTHKILLVVLLNIFFIIFVNLVWWLFAEKTVVGLILSILLQIIILIFVNMELIINQSKTLQQKRRLRTYRKYIPIINNLIIEVRNKQQKHFQDLKRIEEIVDENDDYEKLSRALDAYSDKMIEGNVPSSLLKINYKLLAGVLFTMIHKAYERNITLDIRLTAVHFTSGIYEYQLVELVEILVDNAIEATSSGGTCYLTLGQLKDTMQIRTSNPGPLATSEYIHNIFKSGYTSKNNELREHGIGLYKLSKIVNQNNGNIIVNNEIIDGIRHICFEINI